MRAMAALLAAAALLLGACGGDSDASAPPDRPPLGSPPDPGEVPEHDGLSDTLREDVLASTVRISGFACGRSSEGSGFAVADHLVVTNAHVIVGLDEPMIELADGTEVAGLPVAFDPVADLAILRVDGVDFDPLPLGTAADHTIGAVFGWERGPTPEPTPFRIDRPVTVRIEAVASTERIERRSWLLAAYIESGDSGAALVDDRGVVVGIAYATTTRGSGVGYATRASELETLIATGFNDNLVVPDC